MYILDVIPIAKGISRENLSYFSSKKVAPGNLIKVPLRSKTALALVMHCKDAAEAKSEIRSLTFQIKKIEKVQPHHFLRSEFIESAEEAGRYFAGSTGSVLHSIIPKVIVESADELKIKEPKDANSPSFGDTPTTHEKLIIQAPDEERIAHYKSLIREEFAKKRSVLFCLPTIHDIKKIITSLPKGIEDYVHVVHGSLSKKELVKVWQSIQTEVHAVLIIGTGMSFAIPRSDIGAIIVERESAAAYKLQTRPYVDLRTMAEFLAKRIKAKLIFGDVILRTETLHRYHTHELIDLVPLKFRSLTSATQTIVDMKKYKTEEESFRILSDELKEVIGKLQESNENLFLFGARRGLAPMTVCSDCGNIVTCNNCSSPIVLHTSPKGNFFLCHKCGERRSAEERCKNCESWRLAPLGIGIERIEKEILEAFPTANICRIDKDSVKTLKQGMKVMEKFYSSPGSILLGTELALLYIDKQIENAAVVSLDSLFALPDFRINEKIMALLVKIRNTAEKKFILQTRQIAQPIWNYATQGNLVDFYREELAERERYEYPPFWIFIKITCAGERNRVIKEMKNLEELLAPFEVHTFPAFTERIKGKYVMHGILKVKREEWVDETLLSKLLSLPPYFMVKVDPESLL